MAKSFSSFCEQDEMDFWKDEDHRREQEQLRANGYRGQVIPKSAEEVRALARKIISNQ
ncbi:hypothetical protein [Caulobacter phage Cr30]|uniref:hypothetical protein n=1 Tax=Caulobacter phage Cr30 TaxID=1357714 RepID=UPI0004A9B5C3|nr:hypothetical protein OZ74_gp055 [Caulobacter phage Cr30]AGS80940.1 hypothetical protein [Caulobacter phage Cr30]